MISRQSAAINSARAVMTLGVIVFHTARIFDPYVYYMKASEQSQALAPLILFGVLWAMPLFFLVAGFALWHSLGSRGAANFIRDRGKRLLLPLTVGLLTLVPFQIYISRIASGEHISYLDSMRDYLDVHLTLQLPFPVQGLWFDYSHLWFIAYLFSFSLMLLPVVIWARRRPQPPRISPSRAIAIWVVAIVAAAGLEAWIGMEGTGAWDRWSYLIFMALGILLAWQPSFGDVLVKRLNLILASACVGFLGLCLAAVLMHSGVDSLQTGGAIGPVLWRAGKAVVGILFLIAIVGSLSAYKPKVKKPAEGRKGPVAAFFGYISPISLPLYMLHLTLILSMGYFVLQWPVPASAQFLAIVLLTLMTSIAIVEVARRTRLGSLLLGMKHERRARPVRTRAKASPADPEPAPAATPALVPSSSSI